MKPFLHITPAADLARHRGLVVGCMQAQIMSREAACSFSVGVLIGAWARLHVVHGSQLGFSFVPVAVPGGSFVSVSLR